MIFPCDSVLSTVPKVMDRMGFKWDPSTAGSSVRFDPPNPLHKVRLM